MKSDATKVVELYDLVTDNFIVSEINYVVSDIKDNYLFALAFKAKADHLVTGDKLLLYVSNYKKTKIITFVDFRTIVSNT